MPGGKCASGRMPHFLRLSPDGTRAAEKTVAIRFKERFGMPKFGFLRIALLAMLVVLFQGTWALAGTTGTLSGYVVQPDGTALADAKVTATSPSESSTATTDAGGHFVFVSLTPDTYTVTASKDGY